MASRNEFDDRTEFQRCCFCQDAFQSTNEIHAHLIQCGNKTEQCPNCRKYVRRAVFTYHYENSCTNLDLNDESDSKIEIPEDKRWSSDDQMNLAEENERHREIWPSETSDTNSSGSIQTDNRSNNCDDGKELIKLPIRFESADGRTDNSDLQSDFGPSINPCNTHETQIDQRQTRSTLKNRPKVVIEEQPVDSSWKLCRYCNARVVSENLSYHQKYCEQNVNCGFEF